ncbi:MAG: FAD:protein FMN transferase, partial [Gammaproteobacteria bacterium]
DWPTGIVDPADREALIAVVGLGSDRRAMATSGSAERGDHIWAAAQTGPVEFAQVSVLARGIVVADILATAIVAGGREALDDAAERFPIDVLAVCIDGTLLATPGVDPMSRTQAGTRAPG